MMGEWLFSGQNLGIFGSDVISLPDIDTDLLVVENLCNVRIIGSDCQVGEGVITKPASFSHTPSSSCWQLAMLPIPQFTDCVCVGFKVCASALCVCVEWNERSAYEMGSRPVTAR